jgi:hypothetical protein
MIYVIIAVVVVLSVFPFFRLLTSVSKRRNRLTAAEVADKIDRHLHGTEGAWDWDDFTSTPIADDGLDAIRERCVELDSEHPMQRAEELREIVERLRKDRPRS